MGESSKPGFTPGFKLYVLAGVIIFISIGYAIFNKPEETAKSEAATLPAPAVSDSAAKAKSDLEVAVALEKKVAEEPTIEHYLSLAYVYYNAKRYKECIEMNRKAIALNPKLSIAYNNICSAYNSMSEWDSAVIACNMALKIQPDLVLAKNNLAWTYKMIKESK